VSACAFQGVKDTLHTPVAGKIFAAEAGPGSPHRRFALTLAGVAGAVKPCFPRERGRPTEVGSQIMQALMPRSGIRMAPVNGPVPSSQRETTTRKGVAVESGGDCF
jgi:hypothetical protein